MAMGRRQPGCDRPDHHPWRRPAEGAHGCDAADGRRTTLSIRSLGARRVYCGAEPRNRALNGFHIHAVGKCEPPDFTSAGPHFNPYGKHHGLANPDGSHAGDFPNLKVGAVGTGSLDTTDSLVTLKEGPTSVFRSGGTSLIVHADADDEKTDPAGNSGVRIACGVIERRSAPRFARETRARNTRKGPCELRDFGTTLGAFRGTPVNPKVVMAPERFVSDSARDRSANPRGPRSLFFRASSCPGARRVLTRGDLRAVMTSETVPVEQPGTLVDELRIRDRAVETVYVERMRPGRKASDEG